MKATISRAQQVCQLLCTQIDVISSELYSDIIFSECVLGKLFVRGFRLLRKQSNSSAIIFFKRASTQTQYLYLKIFDSICMVNKEPTKAIDLLISHINQMRNSEQTNYTIMFCFLKEKQVAELNQHQYKSFKEKQPPEFTNLQSYLHQQREQEQLLLVKKQQLNKLKEIICNYIDTFGLKYKTNLYCELQRQSTTNYDVRTLINTISWMVYNQTLNKPYNQIQSANWTCFDMKSKEKMVSDRKDIVFTGSSKILMIAMIFIEDIEEYAKESENQAKQVLLECKNSYVDGLVKIYKIHDILHESGVIYNTDSLIVNSFSTI